MKVIKTSDALQVQGEGFTSHRILLASDNMGFSLHKTVIPKGDARHWHYKQHLEACYCISGEGVLTNLESGKKFTIKPDTTYVLDRHDNHTFQAITDVVLISVFNPPVSGTEIHGEDGSYLLSNKFNKDKAEKIVESVYGTCNKFDAIENVQNILNHAG